MDKLFFRNDDINPNTDIPKLIKCYRVIRELYPKAEIYSCITLFAKDHAGGSVYPNVPFKDNPTEWFYGIDRGTKWNWQDIHVPWFGTIVSHGLFHTDHSKLSKDAQEMSIIASCSFLKTKTFMPPYGRQNEDTIRICRDNNIQLILNVEWKSLEFNKFDPSHKHWYFHSWRYTPEKLREALSVSACAVPRI